MKAQYFLPDRVDHLKTVYLPGFFGNYTPTNHLKEQKFPDSLWEGRKKRDIAMDKISGQTFEKYDGILQEVGDEELVENNEVEDEEVDGFDDEFEGADLTKENFKYPDDTEFNLRGSRWTTYDGLAKVLDRFGLKVIF